MRSIWRSVTPDVPKVAARCPTVLSDVPCEAKNSQKVPFRRHVGVE